MILHSAEALQRYTQSGHWGQRTLLDHFYDTARQEPERVAVVDPADRPDLVGTAAQKFSYREFAAMVDAIATGLLDLGLQKDEIVVVQLPNVWELIAMYLAVSRAGGVLSPMPIQWRDNEFQNVKNITQARFFFGLPEFKGAEPMAIAQKLGFTAFPTGAHRRDGARRGRQGPARRHPHRCQRHFQPVLVFGHRSPVQGLSDVAQQLDFPDEPDSQDGRLAPRGQGARDGTRGQHDRRGHLAGFGGGGRHHLAASPAQYALAFVSRCMHEEVHFTLLVPAVLNLILKLPQVDQLDFSNVRCIAAGSSQPSRWSMEEFKRRWNIEIVHGWGQTEGTAIFAGAKDVPEFSKRADHFPWWGCPGVEWPSGMRGVELKLLDELGAECTQPGQVGELAYRGPNVFAGYYRRPDLAQSAFTPDGFYRTGDFFIVRDAHHIGFFDRKKDIIIRGGFNVSAAEVENLVLTHPGVQEAAAIAVPDEIMGEKTCVFVVPKDKANPPTLEDIVTHLKGIGVAAYKLPERLEYLEVIPRNPVGKILKAQLRKQLLASV